MKKISIIFLALVIVSGFVFQAEASAKSVWVCYVSAAASGQATFIDVSFERDLDANSPECEKYYYWLLYDKDGDHVAGGSVGPCHCHDGQERFLVGLQITGDGTNVTITPTADLPPLTTPMPAPGGPNGLQRGFLVLYTAASDTLGNVTADHLFVSASLLSNNQAVEVKPWRFSDASPGGTQDCQFHAQVDPAVPYGSTAVFVAISQSFFTLPWGNWFDGPAGNIGGGGDLDTLAYDSPDGPPPLSSTPRSCPLSLGCVTILEVGTDITILDTYVWVKGTYTPPYIDPERPEQGRKKCTLFGLVIIHTTNLANLAVGHNMKTCASED